MLEFVADHLLYIAAVVEVGFAIKGVAVDLAERGILDGADIGEEAVAGMHLIEAGEAAPDRQTCGVIR